MLRPETSDLRKELRNATAASHGRLDDLISRFDYETVAGYRAFLELHAAVLLPIERWLEAGGVAEYLPDWQHRARSAALRQDLAALGLSPGGGQEVTYDNAPCTMAGVLYVMEGSRLGGRVLLNRVRSGGVGLPAAFLEHGAGETLWRSFLTWLGRQPNDAAFAACAARAACNVFELYCREAQRRLPAAQRQNSYSEVKSI